MAGRMSIIFRERTKDLLLVCLHSFLLPLRAWHNYFKSLLISMQEMVRWHLVLIYSDFAGLLLETI